MARIWTSGGESGNWASEGLRTDFGATPLTTAIAHSGSWGFRYTTGTMNAFTWTGPLGTTYFARFYVRWSARPSSDHVIARFFDQSWGTVQIGVYATSAGVFQLRSNLATHATGTTTIQLNTWYRVEMRGKIATGATDEFEARAYVGESGTPIDTLGPVTGVSLSDFAIGVFEFGNASAGSPIDLAFDDFAINDSAGAADNSWVGPADPASYVERVLNEASIVHYWKMQEASGTFVDDSKGAVDGTSANVTFGTDTPVVQAPGNYILNGTTGQVDVPHNSDMPTGDTDAYTVEFWWRARVDPSVADFSMVLTKTITTSWQYGPTFYVMDDGATMRFNTRIYTTFIAATSLTDATWYHLAGMKDAANNMSFYVNGQLIGGPTAAGGTMGVNTSALSIGYPVGGGGFYTPGRVAHVAWYNSALSGVQVAAHYAATITADDATRIGTPHMFSAEFMP